MADLIILEDEFILREELAEYLGRKGHRIDAADNVAEFDRIFRPDRHTIAIIDIGLPDGNGLDVVQQLRTRRLPLGIIVLTARSTTPDKVTGLVRGADHYLPKGTDLDELASVIGALQRRLETGGVSQRWILQASGRKLVPPGLSPIDLSAQDFAVLKTIISGKGLTISRRTIVEALGNDYLATDPARLDTQIRRLRRKISEATGREMPLKTLRNEGYQFHEPAEVQ